jgi:hypothetical protein
MTSRTHTPLDIQKIQSGWRKRQVFDADYNYERDMRNRTLEEVAKEIEKMTVFGKDTVDSFVVYIRGMKR